MIKNEKDFLKKVKNIEDIKSDSQIIAPRHYSHKNTYNPDGFHMINFETHSFIVDCQLLVDENFEVEKPWY